MKTNTDEPGAKMRRKDYEKELRKLQVQLCRLQDWVKFKGLRGANQRKLLCRNNLH